METCSKIDIPSGQSINIPLPPGCGNKAYLHAMDTIVLPAFRAFNPDLIMVSSGVDANNMDQMARMCVTTDGFSGMAERLLSLADEICDSKIVFIHEG